MKIKPVTGTLILFALFLAYSCACLIVDQSEFEPKSVIAGDETYYGRTKLGFSWLNLKGHNALDYDSTFFKLSEYLGYVTLLAAAALGCFWLYQLIRTKSILKVDPCLNATVATFALLALFYVIFELLHLNYRPVVLEGELEASYPSTHTLLGCVVFGCGAMVFRDTIKDKSLARSLSVLCWVLAFVLVLFRTLSGVHWISDILGGLLLSAALLCFAVFMRKLQENAAQKEEK